MGSPGTQGARSVWGGNSLRLPALPAPPCAGVVFINMSSKSISQQHFINVSDAFCVIKNQSTHPQNMSQLSVNKVWQLATGDQKQFSTVGKFIFVQGLQYIAAGGCALFSPAETWEGTLVDNYSSNAQARGT